MPVRSTRLLIESATWVENSVSSFPDSFSIFFVYSFSFLTYKANCCTTAKWKYNHHNVEEWRWENSCKALIITFEIVNCKPNQQQSLFILPHHHRTFNIPFKHIIKINNVTDAALCVCVGAGAHVLMIAPSIVCLQLQQVFASVPSPSICAVTLHHFLLVFVCPVFFL